MDHYTLVPLRTKFGVFITIWAILPKYYSNPLHQIDAFNNLGWKLVCGLIILEKYWCFSAEVYVICSVIVLYEEISYSANNPGERESIPSVEVENCKKKM